MTDFSLSRSNKQADSLSRALFLPASALLLALLAATLIGSAWYDSAIFDETAHIGAAYSYVSQLDYRLNPEHPPLIKDLAGLPLLMLNLRFPTDTDAWRAAVNGQWDQGRIFLYQSGNDPDAILFWSRLPVMALSLLFGALIAWWARRRYGSLAALLALALYAFSPTVIAHSRYVTTDLGASFAFFAGLAAFIAILERRTAARVLFAGLIFGLAQTVKFSLFLLVPIYLLVAFVWSFAHVEESLRARSIRFIGLVRDIVLIGLVGLAVIWIVFAPHLINYPAEKNLADAKAIIDGFRIKPLVELDYFLLSTPLLRPIGQYLFGLIMITQRAAGGNTQYFLGEITSQGSRLYFPLLYLLKETLAFHALSLLALLLAFRRGVAKGTERCFKRMGNWIASHPAEFTLMAATAFYWAYSIMQPLNIGVRHVMPTFPLIFILVARSLSLWITPRDGETAVSRWDRIRLIFQRTANSLPRVVMVGLLLLLAALSSLSAFPSYLSYFNVLGGGSEFGYRIATDSNYDWGQDLIRLRSFMREIGAERVSLDYFGGGNPEYYFGNTFEPWWSARGPAQGLFAVSANTLMGAYGRVGPGFSREEKDSYEWLKSYQPVGRAGQSIFIYRLP